MVPLPRFRSKTRRLRAPRPGPSPLASIAVVALAAVATSIGGGSGRLHADVASEAYAAKVVRVVDGDTVDVEAEDERRRLRLAQIDAPESIQPHGPEATRALERLTLGRPARVEPITVDRYGREVVELYVDGIHVNRRMVREGNAWVYQRYAVDEELRDLESAARSERAGLWALPEPERIPPWAWRAAGRAAPGRDPEPRSREDRPLACGSKRLCREMDSCEEAMFYLRECGLTRLDGDRDGVPCERLCTRSAGGDER